MIKADEQGNLYTFIDNDGYFNINGVSSKGTVCVLIKGDEEIVKRYPASKEIRVELTNEEIQAIGVGQHIYYIDVIDGGHKDTVISQQFIVAEKGE